MTKYTNLTNMIKYRINNLMRLFDIRAFHWLVFSRIRYCIELYVNIPLYLSKKVLSEQLRSICVIF